MRNLTGSVQIKNGIYYTVINLYDPVTGKRNTKWETTALKVRGNKRNADEILRQRIEEYSRPKVSNIRKSDDKEKLAIAELNFHEYLLRFNQERFENGEIEEISYLNQRATINGSFRKYFGTRSITVGSITEDDIDAYLNDRRKTVIDTKVIDGEKREIRLSENTVKHDLSIIKKALSAAVKKKILMVNPATGVELRKIQKFTSKPLTAEELNDFLDTVENPRDRGLFFVLSRTGARRSEVLGFRYSQVDFKTGSIQINHSVYFGETDGKRVPKSKDKVKSASSNRSLILPNRVLREFEHQKDITENNRQRMGNTYNTRYLDYVFVDELGNLKIPDMVSHTFHKYMKAFIYGNEERFARFRIADGELQIPRVHDLRHTCASLLVKDGVSLSIIKDWLGHSSITITSDTYSHIYEESKKETAVSIGKIFGDDEEIIASHDEGTDKKAGEENTSPGLRQNKPVRKKGEMER